MKTNNPGIYTITSILDNKILVGQSKSVESRLTAHKALLRRNKHDNPHLQYAYNVYGKENFLFEILVYEDEEFLLSSEMFWSNLLNSHDPKFGYNIKGCSPTGYTSHSLETRNKISKSNMGKKQSEEFRRNCTIRYTGRKLSQEHKDNISKGLQGRKMSEDHRQKMLKSWATPKPPMTDEHKFKLKNGLKDWLNKGNGFQPKKVIDTKSGLIYNSMSECLKSLGICYAAFIRNINGKGRYLDKFNLKYV